MKSFIIHCFLIILLFPVLHVTLSDMAPCDVRRQKAMLLGRPDVTNKPTGKRHHGRHLSLLSMIVPRGGGGGASTMAEGVAITGSGLVSVYGFTLACYPWLAREAYGIETTPIEDFVNRNAATTIYTTGIAMTCLVYLKTSLNMAIAAALAPVSLRTLYNVVQDKPTEMGYSQAFELMNLAVYAVATWATTFGGANFAPTAIQGVGAWMLLTGLFLFVNPTFHGNVVVATVVPGGKNKRLRAEQRDDRVNVFTRNYGNDLICVGVFFAALGLGVDFVKTFGYTWLVGASGLFVMLAVTKDIKKYIPTAVPSTTLWTICMAVVGAIATFS